MYFKQIKLIRLKRHNNTTHISVIQYIFLPWIVNCRILVPSVMNLFFYCFYEFFLVHVSIRSYSYILNVKYSYFKQIQTSNHHHCTIFQVVDMCRTYNPEIKFIFEVAIIPGDIPEGRPPPRRNSQVVYKCAKLRLSSAQSLRPPESTKKPSKTPNDTLILTAMPGPEQRSEIPKDTPDRKARELCFVNIQTKLRQRGVSLRHQFPEVYGRLVDFVADGQHFTPITLFPVDGKTGKKFMCLIMPEADADVEWMHRPGLLEELGLSTPV